MGQKSSVSTLPESHVIRCYERKPEGCCPKSEIQFDTSAARVHYGLIQLIGAATGSGPSNISQKFDELEQKLEDIGFSPCLRIIRIILFIIPLVNVLAICTMRCTWKYRVTSLMKHHFEDWSELGIEVRYIEGSKSGQRRKKTPSYMLITLPFLPSKVP